MSASFNKAYKAARKEHRERSQPHNRRKLGLLEKGKDWKQRREDFHSKEKRLKALAVRARERNPDEFYFGMVNARTKDGVHQQPRASSRVYTEDELKLMRTQDVNYMHMRRGQELKTIEKLKGALHGLAAPVPHSTGGPQHTVFVDTAADVRHFDPVKFFDTVPELADRAFNRPRRETLASQSVIGPTSAAALRKLKRQRLNNYHELEQRLEREKKMRGIIDGMQLQRDLKTKGRRSKVAPPAVENCSDDEDFDKAKPTVYRWRKERKR